MRVEYINPFVETSYRVLQEVLAEVPGNPELTALLTSLARTLEGN